MIQQVSHVLYFSTFLVDYFFLLYWSVHVLLNKAHVTIYTRIVGLLLGRMNLSGDSLFVICHVVSWLTVTAVVQNHVAAHFLWHPHVLKPVLRVSAYGLSAHIVPKLSGEFPATSVGLMVSVSSQHHHLDFEEPVHSRYRECWPWCCV